MANSDIKHWNPGEEPRNEDEVRELLQSIRENNGCFSDEKRAEIGKVSLYLLSAIANLKGQLSKSVLQYVSLMGYILFPANKSDCQKVSIPRTVALSMS